MQIRLRKKWQVVFGICILLLGLMLIRYTDKSREVVPPQEDFDSSIFDVDEEMRAIGLGEFKQHSAPLIEKALSAILAKRMLEPKLVRRVLTTDREDYVLETGKQYTIFYYLPLLFSQSALEEQVRALRRELYANPSTMHKEEIRKELNPLLKHAEFTKAINAVVLLPSQDPNHVPNHHHPHNDHDAHH